MADSQPHPGASEDAPRPLHRMSSLRLEAFSDGVFAIAITLLALQLRPPNLDGATTVGGVLHALAEQRVQFGYYALAFVVVGGLWLEHHQLLDPMQTHGRRLARTNLLFLLPVSLLPYWVSVLEAHHDSGAAGGLLLLDMALTRIAFVLVCLGVRAELGPGKATSELVMPALLQSAGAAVLLLAIGGVVVGNPPDAGVAVSILVVVYLLVVRLVVRTWRVRHRRRLAG
jgi:uncharacterized membrane protein